ncbi:MAG: hypothetical protein WB679_15365 [Terracidiphilus sp.]
MSTEMNRKKLEVILDNLVDSVESTPAEELFAEAARSGQDTTQVATRAKDSLLKGIRKFEQRKLHTARSAYRVRSSELRSRHFNLPATADERRRLLFASAKDNRLVQRVTARFRDLTDLSDEDVDSALEDLMELGAFDEEDTQTDDGKS